jgi:hypothetical protein
MCELGINVTQRPSANEKHVTKRVAIVFCASGSDRFATKGTPRNKQIQYPTINVRNFPCKQTFVDNTRFVLLEWINYFLAISIANFNTHVTKKKFKF